MVLKCPSNYKQLKTEHVPLVVGRSGSCLRVPPECYHVVFMFWPIEHHHTTPHNHLTVMFKASKMGLRPSPVLYEFGEVLQLSQLHWGQAPDSSTYRAAGTCAPFVDLSGRPKWHIQKDKYLRCWICLSWRILLILPLCRTTRAVLRVRNVESLWKFTQWSSANQIDHATYYNSTHFWKRVGGSRLLKISTFSQHIPTKDVWLNAQHI